MVVLFCFGGRNYNKNCVFKRVFYVFVFVFFFFLFFFLFLFFQQPGRRLSSSNPAPPKKNAFSICRPIPTFFLPKSLYEQQLE